MAILGTKKTAGQHVFDVINTIILISVACITLYPFLYVLASSMSGESAVIANKVWFYPVDFTLNAYKGVIEYPGLITSYYNTIFYTVVGTIINMVLTICAAYPLSKQNFRGRQIFSFAIVFTMLFNGGMIPTYLCIRDMQLLDTRWAILLPGAINTWNMIIMRSFFRNMPKELEEAARIDGCGELGILFRIVLPLSTAAIATITLFYAVAHWNSYFQALIYLPRRKDLRPVQLLLREIILQNQTEAAMSASSGGDVLGLSETIKYATIIVAAGPIILIYPFVQKYFVTGVMVGAIKG